MIDLEPSLLKKAIYTEVLSQQGELWMEPRLRPGVGWGARAADTFSNKQGPAAAGWWTQPGCAGPRQG